MGAKMKNMFTTLIASILLTACATTETKENSNVAEKTNEIVFTGFSSSEDGTMTQTMRGFVCPPKVNAMELKMPNCLALTGVMPSAITMIQKAKFLQPI